MARSARHDRLRCVADRFDVIAGIEKGDDAAGAALEPLVAPGERADQRPLVQHELDVAAEIFRVQQPFLKRPAVKRRHVRGDPAAGFLVVYSNVPKNSPGVLPCSLVNCAARSGRMLRIEVFMAWSHEPVSMPHHLIFFFSIQCMVSTLGPG